MSEISKLAKVAAALKDPYALMGSKWRNCEAEVIAWQTIKACAANEAEHGEAISWLGRGCLSGRQLDGTNNARGLAKLVEDGALVREVYEGTLPAPESTAQEDGRPLVLRVTPELLNYVIGLCKLKI